MTLLLWAWCSSNPIAFEALLELGGGSTPCHLAVYRNASYIPKLISKGADPNIRDVHGRTVFDLLQLSIDQKWTFHEESVLALQKIKSQDR
jgi:ankyrin repeat protein